MSEQEPLLPVAEERPGDKPQSSKIQILRTRTADVLESHSAQLTTIILVRVIL
jgi:hypothetical protein